MSQQDEGSLESLFVESRDELVGFLTGLVGADRAQDVIQEAYFRLRRVESPEALRNPKAYLFRIASNLAHDELRKAKRHAELNMEYVQSFQYEQDASTSQWAEDDEQLALVAQAIATLPAKCKMVFEARRLHGQSYRAIADEQGISEKTVENHVGRALNLIRAFISERTQ